MPISKYLLVSPGRPKTIAQSSNPTTDIQAIFPVGIAYVSSALKKEGYEVYTVNLNFTDGDLHTTLSGIIKRNDIQVVCTGGQSIDVHEIRNIIATAKKINPEILVVVGGAIISSDPQTAMNVLCADVGVIGEGEAVMCDLAQSLRSGKSLGNVAGIIYQEDGGLKRTARHPEIDKLDDLPFMDFEGFGYSQWLALNYDAGILFSARSCPFQCTFCFKSTGKRYRQRSLDSVFKEIDYQIDNYAIKTLSIGDELFATNKNRVYEFCKRIRKYAIHWACSIRVQEIDTDLIRIMKDSGCVGIGTGLESGSSKILKSMKKGVSVKQVEDALKVFSNSGISMLGNFIFGDVAETRQTVRETIALWKKYYERVYINLGTVCTFPGSRIYEIACDRKIIADREQYLKNGSFFINISSMKDSEYIDMLSTITELSYLPQIPADSVEISKANDEGLCRLTWRCRGCGGENTLSQTHFLQAPIATCSCGLQNTVEPFRDICCDEEILLSEFNGKEPMVFWGVGSQYCRIRRNYRCLNHKAIIQIDGNTHQQKMRRLGQPIYHPKIIADKNIDAVIVTSPVAKNSIMENIIKDFPSVKTIYFPKLLKTNGRFSPVLHPISIKNVTSTDRCNVRKSCQ